MPTRTLHKRDTKQTACELRWQLIILVAAAAYQITPKYMVYPLETPKIDGIKKYLQYRKVSQVSQIATELAKWGL